MPVISFIKRLYGYLYEYFMSFFQFMNKAFTDRILPLDGGKKRP